MSHYIGILDKMNNLLAGKETETEVIAIHLLNDDKPKHILIDNVSKQKRLPMAIL